MISKDTYPVGEGWSNKSKRVIQIIRSASFSTFKQARCPIAMLRSVHHIAPKQRSYTCIPSWLTWVKWQKDLPVRRRWKVLIRRLLTWNPRLCSRHFNKEKISSDGYRSSNPAYFAWDNWGKPQARRKDRKGTSLQIPGWTPHVPRNPGGLLMD